MLPTHETDPSWPEKLPTDGAIRSVFDGVFGYGAIGALDDPYLRAKIVDNSFIENYEALTTGLHSILTDQHDTNHFDLTGRQTDKSAAQSDSLTLFHGLDRTDDIAKSVLPPMQVLFDRITATDLPPERKLQRMAAVAGVIVAQSQGFSDGNNRIARAIHDFIRDGRMGLSSERVFDVERTFTVPAEIEEMILAQNVGRIINGRHEYGRFQSSESTHVSAAVQARLDRSAKFLENIYGKSVDTAPSREGQLAPTKLFIAGLRKNKVARQLGDIVNVADEQLSSDVIQALRQRKYGPAAWTVAFGDKLIVLPLDESAAEKLVRADRGLLTMRLVSLANGMANGGRFEAKESYTGGAIAVVGAPLLWAPKATL